MLIHIGGHGQPIYGRGRTHRMAMATAAGIPWIPARIGMIHGDALALWRQRYSAGAPVGPGANEHEPKMLHEA